MLKVTGFTLVEVLVASMLIMLGVTGYVSLQSEYVLADDKLNLRSRAWQLAKQKLADLNAFTQLGESPGVFAYRDIANNTGGVIPAGENLVQLSSKQHVQAYFLSWEVQDLYYVDSNFDGIADSWSKIADANYPNPKPRFAHLKSILITVAWLDTQGSTKSITLNNHIAPIAMGQSFHTKYRLTSSFAKP